MVARSYCREVIYIFVFNFLGIFLDFLDFGSVMLMLLLLGRKVLGIIVSP